MGLGHIFGVLAGPESEARVIKWEAGSCCPSSEHSGMVATGVIGQSSVV